MKKAGSAVWKMGGTGKGQEDSLVTAMLEKAYGLKVTYIPFKGGGTVAKQLIGKHINSTVNNPSEQMGFSQAGRSRPLATFTPNRRKAFPDVPTFRELGKDLVYFMQRSVVAPDSLMAYGVAKTLSKDPESFGKGNVDGVVAPEAANNAASTGSMLLGGMVIWGLEPGPMLFVEHKEFVWGLIASLDAPVADHGAWLLRHLFRQADLRAHHGDRHVCLADGYGHPAQAAPGAAHRRCWPPVTKISVPVT